MEQQSDQDVIRDATARRQDREAQREQADRAKRERAQRAQEEKMAFNKDKETIDAMAILRAKCQGLVDMHMTMAKDGGAMNAAQDFVQFSSEERLSQIDRAAGIEEIIGLLDRMSEV